MKNITITLDEQTAKWAREQATAQGLSLSRYVGEVVRKQLPKAQSYERAMKEFLSGEPWDMGWPEGRLPTREEIYDRPVFRRR
jgi:hypothetical protein